MKKLFTLFIISHLSFSIFSQSISLDPNSLQLPRLTANPACAVADKGKMIYNTTQEKVLYCNGTAWIDPSTGGVPNNWVNSGANSYLSDLNVNQGLKISRTNKEYFVKLQNATFTINTNIQPCLRVL